MGSKLLIAELSDYTIGVLQESFLLDQCIQSYSPLSLSSGSVKLSLCWGFWSASIWVYWMMVNMDLLLFFYMQRFSFNRAIWLICHLLFSIILWLSYKKLGVRMCFYLYLCLQFISIDLHNSFYVFYASVMWLLLWKIYSILWRVRISHSVFILWFRIVSAILRDFAFLFCCWF